MTLQAGTKLGPYEIVGPLGAGGMGEVYRARDTRLNRSVAIKILAVQFSSDPVHKQRFEREAKTISALNHPHICMLYDIGHQNGIDYLVMEYVEGETLAKRLEKGPLPLEQVLKYGAHIADALDKAHRAGIVHRDLKPGNIMLTATGAKLLDFGLAKPAAPLVSEATLTAVATSPVTQKGTIVGTFQYMSPEQIEGKEVDGRSDIFSLGAVLYEIVTGKRAFEGKGQLSVVSAILEKEPEPITAIKPMTPAALDHAIKKCLAKSADDRWQSANDVKLELQWVAERGSEADAMARPGGLRMGWGLAGSLQAAVLLLVMLGGAVVLRIREQQPTRAMHFESHLPFETNDVALSPDGRVVALVAYSDQANKYMIWTHEVGSQVQAPVTGTEGASHPFWSPDAGFIAFFADGKLKKTDAFGRSVQVLCDAPNGRGGTWNRDGIILFSPDVFEGLYRVPANGGTPVEVTRVDLSGLNFSHRWPRFLPDGKHFLYLGANFTGRFERDSILLGSLESAESRLIVHASSNAAYAEPGYLLYRGEKGLVAHRFDLRSYTLQGDPLTINIEAQYFANIDLTLFDVAGKEMLVAQTGKGAAKSQFVWFDRNGKRVGAAGPPGSLSNPSLSPDGRRVAF